MSDVLSSELGHKDSMGNVKDLPPEDVQRMSAGTGMQHRELNHAADLNVNRVPLGAGHAVAVEGKSLLDLGEGKAADMLVFDLTPV